MIWTFMYHKGPAHLYGNVQTESEEEGVGLRVAVAWCEKNGMRPPASVRPFILADERILPPPEEAEVVEEVKKRGPGRPPKLVSEVTATTI